MQPGQTLLTLTRDEAIKMAISNNPDLAVARYDPAISDAGVAAARGAFMPTLAVRVPARQPAGAADEPVCQRTGDETDIWSSNVGVNQLLPWFGGSYTAGLDAARTGTDSLLTSLNPELAAGLTLTFSQPLLRDFKIDVPRAAARHQPAQSSNSPAAASVRASVNTSADAERAYWLYVSAIALVEVQQRSLDLALELERNNRARVDVGQSPPLDLVAARAEVAQRQENLIIARTAALQTEDQLRTLIIDPKRADYWMVRIEPADRVPVGGLPSGRRRRRQAGARRTHRSRAARAPRFRSATRRWRCRRVRRCPTCGSRRAISATAPAARA